MISAIGLDMRIVLIQAEIDFSRERFVLPTGSRIVVRPFGRARIERNAIYCDAKWIHDERRHPPGSLGMQRYAERVRLRADRVRITPIRKVSVPVAGNAVGSDVTIITTHADLYLVIVRTALRAGLNQTRNDNHEADKSLHKFP